jgi:hypothetical protein
VVASHKKPFMTLGKWKISFLSKENKNFLKQDFLTFQVTQICKIWDHFNKLWNGCGYDIGHLP